MGWLFPSDAALLVRRDRLLALVFAALAVVLIARAARKDDGVLVHNQEWGARFLERRDPYFDAERGQRMHGPYPPSYAWITAPLALLPTTVARIAWASAQIAALLVAFRVLRARTRVLWPELAPHAPVLFAGALLLVSRFLLRDMQGGGGNTIYATLALCALELAWRGREWVAGAVLAFALVLKPNLAPLCLFFACRARWRALAATLVAGAALFAAPGIYFGMSSYAELSARWAASVVEYTRTDDLRSAESVPAGMPVEDTSMNQSLRAALDRALRPSTSEQIDDVHVASLEPATIAALTRVALIALVLAAAVVAWRARGPESEFLAALAFFPLAHLASPISWKAHHTALLALFFALLAVAARAPRRKWLIALLAAYYVLCDLASEELLGKAAKNWLQAVSLVTWFDLALLVATLALALRTASLRSPPTPRPD